MTIKTKYNLEDKVFIKELKIWARILSIFTNGSGKIQYNTRYFHDSSAKECYFYEEELSLTEEENKVGFKSE